MTGMIDTLVQEPSTHLPAFRRRQATLRQTVSCSGIGLHTGHLVTMSLIPAPPGSGIVFERSDLPGHPRIPAHVDYVQATPRCTVIGVGDAKVHTVEHVLAALRAFQIDNVIIQLSAGANSFQHGLGRVLFFKFWMWEKVALDFYDKQI